MLFKGDHHHHKHDIYFLFPLPRFQRKIAEKYEENSLRCKLGLFKEDG